MAENNRPKKVAFTLVDSQEKESYYIIEQTRLNNINYILVADSLEDEATAWILKEIRSDREHEESIYAMVDDDSELDAISGVFSLMLDDMDISLE